MNDFDIPIFKKTYEFYKEWYLRLKDFPRQERYALGVQCEAAILRVLADIISASKAPRDRRADFLDSAIRELNMVRVYIRLAKDIKALDMNGYVVLEERAIEIGKMLGGWLRATKTLN